MLISQFRRIICDATFTMAQPGSPQSSDAADSNSTFESFIAPRETTAQAGFTQSTSNGGNNNYTMERDVSTRHAMGPARPQSANDYTDDYTVGDPYYSNQGSYGSSLQVYGH
jgi:hypothetical protein